MDPLKNSIQAYTVHCDNIERRLVSLRRAVLSIADVMDQCEARSVVVNDLLTADASLAPVCGILADMLREWRVDVARSRANPAASSVAAGVTLDADDKARVMDVDGANNDWSAKNATDDFDDLFGSLTGMTPSLHTAVDASGMSGPQPASNGPEFSNKPESTFSTTPLGFVSTESTDFDALLAGLGPGSFSR